MTSAHTSTTKRLSTHPLQAVFLFPFFAVIAMAIYWPSLNGSFFSDDLVYIVINPWTETLTWENLVDQFDPFGDARFQVVNYAPLHLLASTIERAVFWDDPFGYHLVNTLIHALNAALLMALLRSVGLSTVFSLFGALFFLLHPGNVEAVAWISQLKTNASLALSLGAVLTFLRYPALATLLFAAGLLTKASASVALPMAAALAWSRPSHSTRWIPAWTWIAIWLVIFCLYSIPQSTAIFPRGTHEFAAYQDFGVHLRTIASVGVHYLLMAYTTLGISTFQEHAPVYSLLNPWFLSSIPLTAFFAWRIVRSIRQHNPEAIFWLGAAAAFVPVSQFFPFNYPLADRYLYFLLPGLIGGTLFVLRDLMESVRTHFFGARRRWPIWLSRSAMVVMVSLLFGFASLSAQRAALWTDPMLLLLDSVQNFPTGRSALVLDARLQARQGNARGAVEGLRTAARLGNNGYALASDLNFAPIADHPEYRALMYELAGEYIERTRSHSRLTAAEWAGLVEPHLTRGEYEDAIESLKRAAEMESPAAKMYATRLAELRSARPQIETPPLY